MEYTSLQSLKTDIIKETGKIYEVDYFYYKGFRCRWGHTYEEPRPVYSVLRCDPQTEKDWENYFELRKTLKNIIFVDLW